MYITIAGEHYPCTNASPGADGIVYAGVSGLAAAPTSGVISVCTDDGFELRADDVGAYKRQVLDGSTLTLTDTPAPTPPTADELLAQARAAALQRIEGKCSAAIYSGVTVDGKHYRLTENDQLALNAAIVLATSTGETVSYAADGESGTLMTSAQLSAIGKAGYDWGYVCRTYYAYLKRYIGAETDRDKLAAIHFGSSLPDAYMAALTKLLASAGIDITKYATALSAA